MSDKREETTFQESGFMECHAHNHEHHGEEHHGHNHEHSQDRKSVV